jgi:hypothetical protein
MTEMAKGGPWEKDSFLAPRALEEPTLTSCDGEASEGLGSWRQESAAATEIQGLLLA